jgi:hypothetical protein
MRRGQGNDEPRTARARGGRVRHRCAHGRGIAGPPGRPSRRASIRERPARLLASLPRRSRTRGGRTSARRTPGRSTRSRFRRRRRSNAGVNLERRFRQAGASKAAHRLASRRPPPRVTNVGASVTDSPSARSPMGCRASRPRAGRVSFPFVHLAPKSAVSRSLRRLQEETDCRLCRGEPCRVRAPVSATAARRRRARSLAASGHFAIEPGT